jgi:hypothetical protein
MVKSMVKRALTAGIMTDYLLADAWFGTKAMLRLSQESALVPVLRMKKHKNTGLAKWLLITRPVRSWISRCFTNARCAKPGNRFVGKSSKPKMSTSSLTWRQAKTLRNGLRSVYYAFAVKLVIRKRLPVSMIGRYF